MLRDGRVVARLITAETSADEIAAAMTGRAVELDRVHAPGTPGDVILDVTDLGHGRGTGRSARPSRAGEIVGIAGVAGNGQSELVEALAGLRPVTPAGSRCSAATSRTPPRPNAAPRASPTSPRTGPPSVRRLTASVADNLAMAATTVRRCPPADCFPPPLYEVARGA